jgi:hypothetical protein
VFFFVCARSVLQVCSNYAGEFLVALAFRIHISSVAEDIVFIIWKRRPVMMIILGVVGLRRVGIGAHGYCLLEVPKHAITTP